MRNQVSTTLSITLLSSDLSEKKNVIFLCLEKAFFFFFASLLIKPALHRLSLGPFSPLGTMYVLIGTPFILKHQRGLL